MALVLFKISLSTPGAILQPQPPPCERLVRRGVVEGEELMASLSSRGFDFACDASLSTARRGEAVKPCGGWQRPTLLNRLCLQGVNGLFSRCVKRQHNDIACGGWLE